MEWGDHLPVLLKAQEQGMDPEALRNRPDIPWFYEVFIHHFNILSFSRTMNMNGPNPIDIPAILDYNEKIVKMDSPVEFLGIIQTLDGLFLTKKKKGSAWLST